MLPRLRMTLDFSPSPFEDKPGLVIRDPFHFSEATLIVPPPLVECLEFFDGEHSALDLRAHLVRLTGDPRNSVRNSSVVILAIHASAGLKSPSRG